jgi:hypothetical protein
MRSGHSLYLIETNDSKEYVLVTGGAGYIGSHTVSLILYCASLGSTLRTMRLTTGRYSSGGGP